VTPSTRRRRRTADGSSAPTRLRPVDTTVRSTTLVEGFFAHSFVEQ
jgi:hypothetical protein